MSLGVSASLSKVIKAFRVLLLVCSGQVRRGGFMIWFNLREPINGEVENFTKATGDGRVSKASRNVAVALELHGDMEGS